MKVVFVKCDSYRTYDNYGYIKNFFDQAGVTDYDTYNLCFWPLLGVDMVTFTQYLEQK